MPIFGTQQELDLTLFVDNKLIFKNPQTGRIKKVKVGFCYWCFIFDWVALFIKGLPGHGLFVLGYNIASAIIFSVIVNQSTYHYRRYGEDTDTVLVFAGISLVAWLIIKIGYGMNANEIQAKAMLNRGWILQNAEAAKDTLKAENWQLGQDHISYPPPSRPKD